MLVITRLSKLVALALIAATLSGCAAAMSYRKGFEAGQRRDWDAAVEHYRQAVQEDPDKPEYRIALERASMEAALIHAFAGKEFEHKGELDAALREFKRASEYEPSNRQLAAKVADLDRVIRERIEASRPARPCASSTRPGMTQRDGASEETAITLPERSRMGPRLALSGMVLAYWPSASRRYSSCLTIER